MPGPRARVLVLLGFAAAAAAPGGSGSLAGERRSQASIWPRSAVPAVLDAGPDRPVELGVKFRSDAPGEIVGIRFFKAPANTGPHVVSLWTDAGELLARAWPRAEAASGWQRVDFPRPVTVEPERLYVASYHAHTGHFSVDQGFFASGGFDRPPLHAPGDGMEGPNGLFAYGPAGSFPTQGHRSSNYWVDVVFRPSGEPANTLVAIEISPRHAAMRLGARRQLAAIGKYGDGTSRDITGLVQWRSDDEASVAVDRMGDARAVRAAATRVTASLGTASGAAAVVALAGASPDEPAPAPVSIWPAPVRVVANDPGPVGFFEAGVRFTVDVAGHVTAIRIHRSAGDAGPSTVRLWTGDGALLAKAEAGPARGSGWQEVLLPRPVSIEARERYVASREIRGRGLRVTKGYFEQGVSNPPLHVEVGTPANVGGVFAIGKPGAFPTEGRDSANPWVDVVLIPSTAPPALSSIRIAPDGVELEIGDVQQLRAVGLHSGGGEADVTRIVEWESSDASTVLVDASGVATGMRGGEARILAKLHGVTGAATVTARALPPAPDEGPGGPILVVTGAANGFNRYLAEILRAEGLNEFLATDLSRVDQAVLDRHDLVILGDLPLASEQADMFAAWVRAGGNLIAMRPDPKLAPLLGLRKLPGALDEGYLGVGKEPGPGSGITRRPMQFHGAADLYELDGARAVAVLQRDAERRTAHPAVVLHRTGRGQAAAFAYDLARSVVYTRQGNPAWSRQARSGGNPRRSHDLFYGPAVFDPRPDWVDFSRIDIPQADEQQRLLVNLILHMNEARRPLPRFWYLPSGHRAAVVLTGDDHARLGPGQRLEAYLARSRPGCSVEDWGCVRSTAYVYASDPLTADEAQRYASLGFEISLHLTTGCEDFASRADLEAQYASQLSTFALNYPGLPRPRTTRTHCVTWSDYETQPRAQLSHGIRLDTNYYYWPGPWVRDRPGFMTGSALPMRFADRVGRVIDVFQVATQMTDESGQTYPSTIDKLLDGALGPAGHYGVFTANMHTDEPTSSGADAIVAAAQARGVPVISALQLLEWLDARNQSSFASLEWNGRVLGFTVRVAPGGTNLQAMLPVRAGTTELAAIVRDSAKVPFVVRTVKGLRYALFPASPGEYRATYR